MKRFEQHYPDFKFIGPTPIDFDLKDDLGQCLVNELCNISLMHLSKMRDKKTNTPKRRFGIVFNTDPHDKPGGHWIAMYGCLNTSRICF